jgi:hypothetical protein
MPPPRRPGTSRRTSGHQAAPRRPSINPLIGAIVSAVIEQREAQIATALPFYGSVLQLCKLSQAEVETLTRPQLEKRLTAALNALSREQLEALSQQAFQLAASQGGMETVIAESTRRVRNTLAVARLIPALAIRAPAKGTAAYELKTDTGTTTLHLDAAHLKQYRSRVLQLAQLANDAPRKLDAPELEKRILDAVKTLPPQDNEGLSQQALDLLGPEGLRAINPELQAFMRQWVQSKFPGAPAPASRSVESPEIQQHEPPQMAARDENITIKPDGTLVKDGIPYRSLYAAAPDARTTPTTLLHWTKNPDIRLEGRPLQTFYFAPANRYYISEESIERVANRFIKWRDAKAAGAAGAVTLGHTDDRSGYIGMSEAADIAGVSKRTMWLWASQSKAPTDKALDVIKCTASDYFYIREQDAFNLKRLVPRSGLQRGRRPQLALQPH